MALTAVPGPSAGPLAGSLADIERGIDALTTIRAEMLDAARAQWKTLASVHPDRRASARNLIHYLTLRQHDLRELQVGLAALGLSSLGRAESHAMATVDSVLTVLHALAGRPWSPGDDDRTDFATGRHTLDDQTTRLFGPPPQGRTVRIMVTMSEDAATDYPVVHELVRQGMNCMRINCAHGDRVQWSRMIEHLHRAEAALGVKCQILMDVAGAKLRTGPLAPGPEVVKARPRRDVFGHVTAPARIWLTDVNEKTQPPSPADATLPVPNWWLKALALGDAITCRDARDAKRRLQVVDLAQGGVWAELGRTAYFTSGMALRRSRGRHSKAARTAKVGALPALEAGLHLDAGDVLLLTRGLEPGRKERRDAAGRVLTPATIGCSLPQIFDDVHPGESIWFDDGRIGGTIEAVERTTLRVRVTQAPVGGASLRSDKGINLPDSRLRLPPLTPRDIEDLGFIVQHADMVALSFASAAADVEQLHQQIADLGPRRPAVVLKIETRRGFEHLPDMLLAAMKMPSCGVMIARGDLAVELGFERLAEVQEEILWICEAAHIPVIWATQVLEGVAKQGMASRAEITDAAMGTRAECVMLNKGPHIVAAVRTLDDILKRMQAHHAKKRSMLRELRLAHALPLTGEREVSAPSPPPCQP
jgi:pyruvate kinase